MNMQNCKKRGLVKLIALLAVGVLGYVAPAQSQDLKALEDGVRKYVVLMQQLNLAYVDSVDNAALTERAIVSLLKELDPHSVYIPEEEVRKANEPLEGNFEGVGIQFQILHDTIVVVAAIPGGPSDKIGIMAGDKLLKIDEFKATGEDIDNKFVFEHLRGDKGSKVEVSIKRNGVKKPLDFTITRDKIPINSIEASYIIEEGIGYIKLNRFAQTTMEEFYKAVESMDIDKMEGLILDLRSNSGGYMHTAIELADQFLPADKLVVYTEGLHNPRRDYNSTFRGVFEKGKVVVLINEGSASASEIVSGAIQDWDRGLVIGRRSFGKGLVQNPFGLPDGSMIRLTTARYHTPSGRCIQKPYNDGLESYYSDIYKRYQQGEFVHADSIHFPDSLRYSTSKGRTVYGGGGVMPDVFIPLDTTFISDYYTDIRRKGLVNQFIMSYLETHRSELKTSYPTIEQYIDRFDDDDSFFNAFLDFAQENGVPRSEEGLKASGKLIKQVITASLARNIFDVNAYYRVINPVDDELQEALKIIRSDTKYHRYGI